jgi:glycosyltransferase involved in cell wall biosynthesis
MIKVLHLITTLGLSGGGAEANLLRLVRHMDRSRFRNTVVTMTDVFDANNIGLLQSLLNEAEVRLYSLGMKRGVPNPRAAARLYRILRQFRPDTLQTWMYHADLLGSLVGRPARVPSIVWNIRCSFLQTKYSLALVRRALVHLSALPDVVIANSQSGVSVHRALGYKPKRWLYIPNSLDLSQFRPESGAHSWLQAQVGAPPDSLLVGLVARFHPVKDHRTFIQAAQLLIENHPTVHLVLVGRGIDYNNSYFAEAIGSGIAHRFHLMGERLDVNRVTAGLDVACSSSLTEGTSNTLSEAMACGVPCVATDVGDSAIMIQDTGKVVPPGDPRSFARACRELLGLSPEGRRQLGLMARQRVQQLYSLNAVVERYQELYQQLAEAVRRDRRGAAESSG